MHVLLFFRRLQAIEAERRPQVLAIKYSDDEEDEDDDNKEGFCSLRFVSSDEEPGLEKQGGSLDNDSLDSSFQSDSPGEYCPKITAFKNMVVAGSVELSSIYCYDLFQNWIKANIACPRTLQCPLLLLPTQRLLLVIRNLKEFELVGFDSATLVLGK